MEGLPQRSQQLEYAFLLRVSGQDGGETDLGFHSSRHSPASKRGGEYSGAQKQVCAHRRSFPRKLSAPESLRGLETSRAHTNDCPVPPSRERLEAPHDPVTLHEVRTAVAKQSSQKAPGPDKFPGILRKKLPSLLTELARAQGIPKSSLSYLPRPHIQARRRP